MASYPSVKTDRVHYDRVDNYADQNLKLTLLDGSVLEIWGDVYYNGVLLGTGGGSGLGAATDAEAIAGVINNKAVTPANLHAVNPLMDAGYQVGSGADSYVQYTSSAGTSGPRHALKNSTSETGNRSVELELVPDINRVSEGLITTQILMYNKRGQNYERTGMVWYDNTVTMGTTYNGLGLPRSVLFVVGGSTSMGIPGQTVLALRSGASVDLQGSNNTVTTTLIPGSTTVASVVAATSCVLSAPVAPTSEWLAGAQTTQTVIVNGRTVTNCTLTAGSTTVLGNFIAGDVGTAITSVAVFGTNRTRIADMADTGASRLIIDTRCTTPAVDATDKSSVEFRRGGVAKWHIGNNVGGANVDSFDYAGVGGNIRLQVRNNGNIGLNTGSNAAYTDGVGVVAIANVTTVPTTNPTNAGVLYSDAGDLKYRNPSGVVTAIAPNLLIINAQTGTTYTLVLTDNGKLLTHSNAAAITVTVPLNSSVAFPVGSQITLAQIGAGKVTVAATGGVTVNATPSLGFRAQYSSAALIKTATDTWLLVGDLA